MFLAHVSSGDRCSITERRRPPNDPAQQRRGTGTCLSYTQRIARCSIGKWRSSRYDSTRWFDWAGGRFRPTRLATGTRLRYTSLNRRRQKRVDSRPHRSRTQQTCGNDVLLARRASEGNPREGTTSQKKDRNPSLARFEVALNCHRSSSAAVSRTNTRPASGIA